MGAAERLRSALEKHRFVFEGARIPLSASLGVAIWPADGQGAGGPSLRVRPRPLRRQAGRPQPRGGGLDRPPARHWSTMTSTFDPPLDYAAVGLISGLEVHQQLLTDRKLFCHCPAGRYTRTHDGTVLRHMRPTLSELGVYDGTALMEFKTRKHIIYLLNRENTCTYEMDDTPPFPVNQGAVDVAIEQCLMLGCDIVDEVHIARKQYLDGSIPTGFQRTAIVGVNGKLPFRGRLLSITQVSVEEDSCREVSDKGHLIVWRTDRLGMPLIETVTGPDLRTPDEVEEAILLVGRVCRSTGHVRVGMGASRQDVNVSVRGGRRVEIKGVPQAGWAPRLVHGEAWRQANLLRLRDELHERGFRGAVRRPGRGDGRHRVRRLVLPRPAAAGDVGLVRPQPGTAPRLRAGAGAVPRPRRATARPRGDARLAHPAGTHLRPRARRPRAGHRRARPAADPVRLRDVAAGGGRGPRAAAGRGPVRGEGRPRRGLGARARRAHGGGRGPPALRGRHGRRPERDAAAVRRRLDRLRADPARARPHVPGHRLAADAGHARARRIGSARRCPSAPGSGRRATSRPGSRCRSSTTSSGAAGRRSWTAWWPRPGPTCAWRPSSSASG